MSFRTLLSSAPTIARPAKNWLSRWLPELDIPFDRDDANHFLPWIIAVMTALGVFMASAGAGIGNIMISESSELEHRLQIQIPYAEGEELEQATRLLKKLDGMDGFSRSEQLSRDEIAEILTPWIGSKKPSDKLPLPAIVDVWLNDDSASDEEYSPQNLEKILTATFPTLIVDDYQQWVAQFNQLAHIIKLVVYIIALFVVFAAGCVVLLVTHTSLQLHFPIVRLLHRLGAQDHYITRQFQYNAALLTLKGAVPGALVGIFIFSVLQGLLSPFPIADIANSGTSVHIAILIIIPLLILGVVYGATHFSVTTMLRKLH